MLGNIILLVPFTGLVGKLEVYSTSINPPTKRSGTVNIVKFPNVLFILPDTRFTIDIELGVGVGANGGYGGGATRGGTGGSSGIGYITYDTTDYIIDGNVIANMSMDPPPPSSGRTNINIFRHLNGIFRDTITYKVGYLRNIVLLHKCIHEDILRYIESNKDKPITHTYIVNTLITPLLKDV
jgi:hypothetical protein